jgi:hypothetical protein
MNSKTTFVMAAVVFALVGTLVFASVAPYLSDADATIRPFCPRSSPDGEDGQDDGHKGCGKRIAKPR